MLEKGKVSVIVPVYKVEAYIHRCVDSILKQTYTNMEVILVDDGSPDNCGAIVDKYGESDERIKVIHKENGGLSDARNYGMKKATGEFTMFVDSDDWIEKNMVEVMVRSSLVSEADVVQSAFYYAHEDKLLLDKRYLRENAELDNAALMYELVINERVKNFAWGKLYKTVLIRDIPFRKGVLFEDVFWAHHVMHRVKRFILLKQPLYYYFQRDDSIVASYTPKNLDIIKGLKERHQFIAEHYSDLTDESYREIVKMCFIHYNLLLRNRTMDRSGIYRKEIQSYIKANQHELKGAIKYDKALRMQLNFFTLHPFFNVCFLGVKKGLRTVGVISTPAGLTQVDKGGGIS